MQQYVYRCIHGHTRTTSTHSTLAQRIPSTQQKINHRRPPERKNIDSIQRRREAHRNLRGETSQSTFDRLRLFHLHSVPQRPRLIVVHDASLHWEHSPLTRPVGPHEHEHEQQERLTTRSPVRPTVHPSTSHRQTRARNNPSYHD